MMREPPIPGQTPLDDLSGLRSKSIKTTAQLNAAEAENIRRATMKYLVTKPTARSAPFDVTWMKKLHREMFGQVWKWAGKLRKHETNIGSPPRSIEVDLHSLADDLKAWNDSTMPLIEQAARLHHIAVRIHPFSNGNGRWSRMLANIWLKRHGKQPIHWPESTIGCIGTIRDEYLSAVKAADAGDLSTLIALHERFA